jgi:DNA-binding response OmpR family regulator
MVARRKVLVVDDSDLIRDVTQFSLEKHGYEVKTLADPRDLAAALAREAPDVVLVDIGFPGLRPSDVASLVRPHVATCPFLVFSDRPAQELAAYVAELGACGSVRKDVDASALAEAVGPFLGPR